MGHCLIVVLDESPDAITQVGERHGGAVTRQLPTQHPKPNLDLVQPTAVLRRVTKVDSMTRVGEKFAAAGHRLQDAVTSFDTQIIIHAADLGHITN